MKNKKDKKEETGKQQGVKISVGINGVEIETVGMSAQKTNNLLNKVVKKHGIFMEFKRNVKPTGV